MVSLIDQSLGHVQRRETFSQAIVGEQCLMHAGPRRTKGCFQRTFQTAQNIIGVEHCILSNLFQPVGTVTENVRERAGEHAHLPVERGHATESSRVHVARRLLFYQLETTVGHFCNERDRSKRCQRFRQHHGTRTWAAPTMRGREGLVQVDVHRVDAKITRADLPDNGIEVCAIAINIASGRVDRIRNAAHIALKQAAGIWVGNHHPGHIRAQPRLECFQIDTALGACRNILDLEASKGRRCGIGAMRRFGNKDDRSVFAARFERCLDAQDAAQFTMRTRLGRHSDTIHPGQLNQPHRKFLNDGKRTLHRFLRLKWVYIGKACHPCDLFIQARIVFHRARTQREKAEIDGIILPRQARVVAYRFGFRQSRQADFAIALQPTKARCDLGHGLYVDTGCAAVANLENQRLFEHQRTITGKGRGRYTIICTHFGAPSALVDRAHA